MPYSDWPRTRAHRWNDSEPANLSPWWHDCCDHNETDCMCITSADVDLWNSYSGLSGLTAFDPSALSAAMSALEDMGDYDQVRNAYYDVSANSAMWNSAGYVPNIYENLSALYDAVNDKADLSSVSAFYDETGKMHVWTDSEKAAHEAGAYGDYGGTIVGLGTYERPLRVHKDLAKAMFLVQSATNDFTTPLLNGDVYDGIEKDLNMLATRVSANAGNIYQNEQKIEWIINNLTGISAMNMWIHKKVTLEESRQRPNVFFYWQE